MLIGNVSGCVFENVCVGVLVQTHHGHKCRLAEQRLPQAVFMPAQQVAWFVHGLDALLAGTVSGDLACVLLSVGGVVTTCRFVTAC